MNDERRGRLWDVIDKLEPIKQQIDSCKAIAKNDIERLVQHLEELVEQIEVVCADEADAWSNSRRENRALEMMQAASENIANAIENLKDAIG